MRRYPMLNLSDGEYIISAVHRHPIGMFGAVFVTLFILTAVASFLANYESIAQATGLVDVLPLGAALFGGILIMVLALIGGYIAMWVYMSNQFFLTNESVVQEIQVSLFSRLEQTVSLSNIEDASFTQRGVIQSMLNYGSIRLSTEGDETTYRFDYVRNPKGAIATLNNAVEAFKNGRPVEDWTED